jgi:hypothetical protein
VTAQEIIARCAAEALGHVQSIEETAANWRELRAAANSLTRIQREAAALGEPVYADTIGGDL